MQIRPRPLQTRPAESGGRTSLMIRACVWKRAPWAGGWAGAQPLLPQVLPVRWRLERAYLERGPPNAHHLLQLRLRLRNRRALEPHEARRSGRQMPPAPLSRQMPRVPHTDRRTDRQTVRPTDRQHRLQARLCWQETCTAGTPAAWIDRRTFSDWLTNTGYSLDLVSGAVFGRTPSSCTSAVPRCSVCMHWQGSLPRKPAHCSSSRI
jgi:hypothetical protein